MSACAVFLYIVRLEEGFDWFTAVKGGLRSLVRAEFDPFIVSIGRTLLRNDRVIFFVPAYNGFADFEWFLGIPKIALDNFAPFKLLFLLMFRSIHPPGCFDISIVLALNDLSAELWRMSCIFLNNSPFHWLWRCWLWEPVSQVQIGIWIYTIHQNVGNDL